MVRTLALCLSSLTLAACLEQDTDGDCDTGDAFFGNCDSRGGGGGGGGTDADPPAITTKYGYSGCEGTVCALALGGTNELIVWSNDAFNPKLEIGEPVRATLISTGERRQAYTLTTFGHANNTNVKLASDNFPTVVEKLSVQPVRDVRFVTSRYEPATANPAWHSGDSATLALLGPGGDRLVDATLEVSHPSITELAWDRYKLPRVAGTHMIDVKADSIGSRQLVVDTVDSIERLEAVVIGTRVCFYGYVGDREVVTSVRFPEHPEDTDNCTLVDFPPGVTTRTVTASADLTELTVDVSIP